MLDHQPYLTLLCTSSSPWDFMTKNLTSSLEDSKRSARSAPSNAEIGGISRRSPTSRASAAAERQSASRKFGSAAADDTLGPPEDGGLPLGLDEMKGPPPLVEPALFMLLLALLAPNVGNSSAHPPL